MFCIPHDKLINGKWRHEIDQPQCEDNVVFPFPETCQTNYECGMAMTCYNGKCLQSCTQENDCLPGQYCHDNHKVCHDFCLSDQACSVGYVCSDSKCVDKTSVPVPSKCLTISGQDSDSPCTFPFTYQGYKFSTCTKMDWDMAWCSTQVDDRGNYIPNNWGNCGSDCPIESTIVY